MGIVLEKCFYKENSKKAAEDWATKNSLEFNIHGIYKCQCPLFGKYYHLVKYERKIRLCDCCGKPGETFKKYSPRGAVKVTLKVCGKCTELRKTGLTFSEIRIKLKG